MKASDIKQAAAGRWREILSSLGGIPSDILDGSKREHPCPKCGGSTRFRMLDELVGAVFCSHCHNGDTSPKSGDGIAAVQWMLDVDFKEACQRIADYLGLKSARKNTADDSLSFRDVDKRQWATTWLRAKQGIEASQLFRVRWAAAWWPKAAYREDRQRVLAFVVFDPLTWREKGHIIYRADGQPFSSYGSLPERKAHMLGCKGDGLVVIGTPDEFQVAKSVWKCEGTTDALALAGVIPAADIAVANVCGAGSFPAEWRKAFEGKSVVVVGDSDEVGNRGADKAIGVLCDDC